MAHQRKTAAEYGQLSLFEETVPEWLQPAEPVTTLAGEVSITPPPAASDDDDDLSQFTAWLRQSQHSESSC